MKFLDKYKKLLMVAMGVAIFVVTLISLFNGTITWIWEGIAGISCSVLMVWVPEQLANLIIGIIKKITTKLLGNEGSKGYQDNQ